MENSKAKIIKEIAEELLCGLLCYYNPKTNKIISVPDLSLYGEFEEYFKEGLEYIEQNRDDLIEIENMNSSESYKIMEQFVDQLPETRLKSKLIYALQNRKPFKNFKWLIDNSDLRNDWFDFRDKELQKFVEEQLEYKSL